MPKSVRRSYSLVLAAAVAAAVAGCSSPTAPGAISGQWNAGCGSGSSECVGLSLSESGSAVSGTAETFAKVYVVTGAYDRPNVTLVFVLANGVGTAGADTIRYTGTASGGTMTLRTEGPNPETVVYKRGAGVLYLGGGGAVTR
jgi:hypothetical protein